MTDLLKLAELADVDPRTLLTYYSAGRDRMKRRTRARIEAAERRLEQRSPSSPPTRAA